MSPFNTCLSNISGIVKDRQAEVVGETPLKCLTQNSSWGQVIDQKHPPPSPLAHNRPQEPGKELDFSVVPYSCGRGSAHGALAIPAPAMAAFREVFPVPRGNAPTHQHVDLCRVGSSMRGNLFIIWGHAWGNS